MLNTITNITIGIRYARSFRILDVAGEVIDDILYSSDSPFGVKFFPKITEDINRERILYNPETKNILSRNYCPHLSNGNEAKGKQRSIVKYL